MPVMRPLALLPLASLSFLALAPGCILVSNGGGDDGGFVDPYGDIAFDWSFGGETSCAAAGVDELDIALFSGGVLEEEFLREPCAGRGVVLTDVHEGPYNVVVDAYDRNGELLYSGEFFVRVRGEETADAGLVELAAVNAPPPEATGELALFWSFLYPTDDTPEIDCAIAGVDEVMVGLTDLATDAVVFEDVRPCAEEGIQVGPLPEGRYELRLTGTAQVADATVLMYASGPRVVEVVADELTDLGDVALGRVEESFADVRVSFGLVDAAAMGTTCELAGVTEVQVTIQRAGATQPEDAFTVACAAGTALREVFVPGNYTVTAAAQGTSLAFAASVTVAAAAGSVAEAALTLAPLAQEPPSEEPPPEESPPEEPPPEEPPPEEPPQDPPPAP